MSTIALGEFDSNHNVEKKLILENGVIQVPHPDALTNWEIDTVNLPPVSSDCIDSYFRQVNKEIGIDSKNCEALKLGKGLVLSKHIGQIFYCPISPNLSYCFIKSTCVRQTCLRENPYNLWVIVQKKTGIVSGAYCSCVGGVLGCCKHVAGLLYSLKQITEKGENVACTSKPRAWGKYKKFHEPDYVCNIRIKRCSSNSVEEFSPKKKSRFEFDPRAPSDRNDDSDDLGLKDLAMITKGNSAILYHLGFNSEQNSCPYSDSNVVHEEVISGKAHPKSLLEISKNILDQSQNMDFKKFQTNLINEMKLSNPEITLVEESSRNQANSVVWKSIRQGRVTASMLKTVMYKVKSETDIAQSDSLVERILGENVDVCTAAMAYGINQEDVSCNRAFQKLEVTHQNLKMKNCGFFICLKYPFLGATPDRILNCECCGTMPLEVKNPFKGRSLPITEYSLLKTGCLVKHGNDISLKKTHSYYYQVQCQMLVTGSTVAYFCLCTSHAKGLHIERINLDKNLVPEIITKSRVYFTNVIVKSLYLRYCSSNVQVPDAVNTPCTVSKKSSLVTSTVARSKISYADPPILVDFDTAEKVEVVSEYKCPICNAICVDEPRLAAELSIECSGCLLWHHLLCVGLLLKDPCVRNKRKKWFCMRCVSDM